MVLAEQDVTREIVFAYLERIKEAFTSKYGSRASTLGLNSLSREFGCVALIHNKEPLSAL